MNTKEFFSRWKEGIMKITPLQSATISMLGFFIELTGICWGFIFGIAILKQVWISVILGGALIVTGMAALSNYQRIIVLRKIESVSKEQKIKDENGGYIG